MSFPERVTIVEVSPRDGLQNEPNAISINEKIELIERLAAAGASVIEAGAFVSPRWIPQMADSADVLARLSRLSCVRYPVLVPNEEGLDAAIAAGAEEIAVFGAASETFSQKNINCSIAESLDRFEPVMDKAMKRDIRVRGYVSCTLGCPYEGKIAPEAVARLAGAMYSMGCFEISLGDTIGVGTPLQARAMVQAVATEVPIGDLAAHFHDTYGQALANLYAVIELGIDTVDSSVAGLGGCPYAGKVAGNIASEHVVRMLDGMGIETGVDLEALMEIGQWIRERLGRPVISAIA